MKNAPVDFSLHDFTGHKLNPPVALLLKIMFEHLSQDLETSTRMLQTNLRVLTDIRPTRTAGSQSGSEAAAFDVYVVSSFFLVSHFISFQRAMRSLERIVALLP